MSYCGDFAGQSIRTQQMRTDLKDELELYVSYLLTVNEQLGNAKGKVKSDGHVSPNTSRNGSIKASSLY